MPLLILTDMSPTNILSTKFKPCLMSHMTTHLLKLYKYQNKGNQKHLNKNGIFQCTLQKVHPLTLNYSTCLVIHFIKIQLGSCINVRYVLLKGTFFAIYVNKHHIITRTEGFGTRDRKYIHVQQLDEIRKKISS